MLIERKGRILDEAERLDPAHTALVIIDVQRDFLDPEGVFGRVGYDMSGVAGPVERLRRLLDAARKARLLIVFVRASYDEIVLSEAFAETLNRRGHKDSHCREGTPGVGWYGGIKPLVDSSNEVVVTKHRFSGFWGTTLDLYLRSNGIKTVVLAGTATSSCVESTARDAFFLDYRVVIPSDCVQDPFSERHSASLVVLGSTFGNVMDSNAIIAVWASDESNPRGWMPEVKRLACCQDLSARTDPERTALVLVDLQNDFCDPSGALGIQGEDLRPVQACLKSVARLVNEARSANLMVVHVRSETDPLASPISTRSTGANRHVPSCCVAGSWGANAVEAIRPLAGEPQITKLRSSPFPDSSLELLLRSNHISTVIIAGTPSYGSVESTVRDAHNKDFRVVVPIDCVAAPAGKEHLHASSLEVLALGFAELMPSSDIIRGVQRHRTESLAASS